jgi:hypothetical protein
MATTVVDAAGEADETATEAAVPAIIEPAVLSVRMAGTMMVRFTDMVPPQC